MAVTPTYQQRRIINYFVRRTMQGWGRPLAFTIQRLRLGGLFLGVAAVLAIVDSLIFSLQGAWHPQASGAVLLTILIGLCVIACTGFWLRAVPQYYLAKVRPLQEHRGTINAVICDVHAIIPFVDEHFITLREADGRLRAFAIPATLHDQVCVAGKYLTLVVMPGIDYVTAVDDNFSG